MAEYRPSIEDLSQYQNENTDLSWNNDLKLWSDPDWKQEQIKRTEILDFGNEGFLLKHVLTAAECQYYIDQGEQLGFEEIPEAKKSYQNNKRILIQSDELGSLLWERIRPHLDTVEISGDPHLMHIHGPETLIQGTWKPMGLNQQFLLCRYNNSGHFGPHFDGHFVRSQSIRSMKTFMLYLNNEFEDGSTNFVDESQTLYMDEEGRYCAEDKNVLYRVRPEPGMAIIFNHHRLHEGQAIRSGKKYILRTDMMFQRVGEVQIDPEETEALQLAQEAERLEALGECMAAMKLYRKAFKMSASLATSYGCPP